jgi:hypothetical protein
MVRFGGPINHFDVSHSSYDCFNFLLHAKSFYPFDRKLELDKPCIVSYG